jgi:hypothetical protein
VDHAYFIADSTGEAGGTNSTDDKGSAITTDSYFGRNIASSEYGGAIYIDSGTGGQVTNSNFLANSAEYGGAIDNATDMDLIDDDITENHASSEGGGVCTYGGAAIIVGRQITLTAPWAPTTAATSTPARPSWRRPPAFATTRRTTASRTSAPPAASASPAAAAQRKQVPGPPSGQ